jgi:choline dehydrogenase
VLLIFLPTNLGGTIKLHSADPFDKPLIDPGYLTTDFDIVAMRETVRAIKRFVAAPAWADSIISPYGSLSSAISDAEIDSYIRGLGGAGLHLVGSAAMSSDHSKSGVVNQNLLVKGADGLRIVDASVFVSFWELNLGKRI